MGELQPKAILNYHWRGILVALGVMGAWASTLAFALFGPIDPTSSWLGVPLLLLEVHLFAGMFITAHDAMHRLVAPKHKTLNDAIGALCLFCYAFFSYQLLFDAHHEHHRAPASPADPDFHDGDNPSFWRWFVHFMLHYVSLSQVTAMGSAFTILTCAFEVPVFRAIGFWVAPALLAALNLFYFGTYLPHRLPSHGTYSEPHRAQSNGFPTWLSYITCYHFGYHWEHHIAPYVPWWRLPTAKRALSQPQ